eukprot:CAMPEP_0206205688 /NCGR_PEP_ID=MMETSP0166-20121206/14400_1 /ASSEMBLY_ACC=CAM_ASM_000260 /TAXON_ID=95228 /ORGANISM="Vannella robusta, Strain DIVA3 518/3/11/1/6" /LENGTH=667 /DNA_ID=CAMNT_0053625817 /DNA_START=1 /DNA_END=2001 /DNA_ORIENTATION=+
MEDPVVDKEGNTYERRAIEEWLQLNSTSPITRSPLLIQDLAPNRALKDAIVRMIKETGVKPAERQPATSSIPALDHEAVSVSLSSAVDFDGCTKVLATVHPEKGTKRTPVDVACVIDVSGSMSTIATFQNEQGTVESHGLTILDIVKHAVETIIHTLGPDDRLSIIAYSTKAETLTPLTRMDKRGKEISSRKLKNLEPLAATNLWDGLFTGMEILRNSSEEGRLASVFLLTDGMPNICPPRGHLPMLKRYKQRNKWDCIISTFGFGYSMDSKLLHELAIEGNGMYAFIPDSGFVGTTFVNALSNLLVTQATNLNLELSVADGYKLNLPSKDPLIKITPNGANVNLSTLHYGQTRSFVVKVGSTEGRTPTLTSESIISVTLSYQPATSSKDDDSISTSEIENQQIRQDLVALISGITANLSESKQRVGSFCSQRQSSRFSNELEDVKGQVTEAVSKAEYYEKWGQHYLPSLARAHQLQQCNNFKDPGIQSYGGELFNDIRDTGDDIFISLPPPVPTGDISTSRGGSSRYTAPIRPIVSMNSYYCSSNPCFSGDSLVEMANGSHTACNKISKGDLVRTGDGSLATVRCVVKTCCAGKKENMVTLEGGLKITPYHPVRISGTWKFPCDISEPSIQSCPSVFSFVLDCSHSLLINGIECVTLGHDFQDDVV